MDKKIYGIFVAGGRGTRMGSTVPKQFLDLCGRPVLQAAIERFVEAVPGMKVITVLPKECFQTWKDMCAANSFNCPQILVEGGITRFHSVRNALKKIPDGAVVLVHDGVRPLVSVAMIRRMLSAMETSRAVIPSVPVTDTLKSIDQSAPDPDRAALVAVQTPQIFFSEDLRKAYSQAYDTSFTDDGSVLKRAGIPLTFVDGEKYNIKITTPEDLELARLLSGN